MPCFLNLKAVPGVKPPLGKRHVLGADQSIASKRVEIVSTIDDVRSAVMDFGRDVHASHPDVSFFIMVSVQDGSRRPPGFIRGIKENLLRQDEYLRMKGEAHVP